MRKSLIKNITAIVTVVAMTCVCSVTAFAATTASSFWSQNSAGNWVINKPNVGTVKNAWVCDNYNNPSDVNSNWYLMNNDGVMYDGVINDNGHYYLLNPEHNGTYGMMISGTGSYAWNGVTLELETTHNGYYGEIKNTDAVNSLGLKVTNVNTSGAGYEYTADWGNGYGSGGGGSSGQSGNGVSGSSGSSGVTVNSGSSGVSVEQNDPFAGCDMSGMHKSDEQRKQEAEEAREGLIRTLEESGISGITFY